MNFYKSQKLVFRELPFVVPEHITTRLFISIASSAQLIQFPPPHRQHAASYLSIKSSCPDNVIEFTTWLTDWLHTLLSAATAAIGARPHTSTPTVCQIVNNNKCRTWWITAFDSWLSSFASSRSSTASTHFEHSFRLSLVALLHFYHTVVKLLHTPKLPPHPLTHLCLLCTLVSR